MNDIINRKQFLQRFALVGLAMAGGASLLSSCGGGGDKSESTGGSQTSTTTTETAEASDPCSDYTGLTETDLAMRKNLKYVAKSTDEGKNCENCKFYLVDESSTECGKCQLFKGPVSPEGHCASWFAKDQG